MVREAPAAAPRTKTKFLRIIHEPCGYRLPPATARISRDRAANSQDLSGIIKAVLPCRGLCAETPLGPGAEPIAELRGTIAEWPLPAEFQRGVHRPVRIVEGYPSQR